MTFTEIKGTRENGRQIGHVYAFVTFRGETKCASCYMRVCEWIAENANKPITEISLKTL